MRIGIAISASAVRYCSPSSTRLRSSSNAASSIKTLNLSINRVINSCLRVVSSTISLSRSALASRIWFKRFSESTPICRTLASRIASSICLRSFCRISPDTSVAASTCSRMSFKSCRAFAGSIPTISRAASRPFSTITTSLPARTDRSRSTFVRKSAESSKSAGPPSNTKALGSLGAGTGAAGAAGC